VSSGDSGLFRQFGQQLDDPWSVKRAKYGVPRDAGPYSAPVDAT